MRAGGPQRSTNTSERRLYATRSAVDETESPCASASASSACRPDTRSVACSPTGANPASFASSTDASVAPARRSTPPRSQRSSGTAPGHVSVCPGARADSSTSARRRRDVRRVPRGAADALGRDRERGHRGVGVVEDDLAHRRVHRAVVVGLERHGQPRRVLHQELDLLGRHVLRRRHHADHRVVLAVLGEQRELAVPQRAHDVEQRVLAEGEAGRRRLDDGAATAPRAGAAAPQPLHLVDARRHHARRPRRRLAGQLGRRTERAGTRGPSRAAPRGQRSSSSSVARSCEQVVEQGRLRRPGRARGAVRVPCGVRRAARTAP